MKKFATIFAAVMTFAACNSAQEKTAGIYYDNMDLSARAGDDFYKYATGHWLDNNPQPAEYPMWSTTGKVADDNIKVLAEMFKEIAEAENEVGSVEQKIGDIYKMAMDSTRLNAEGAAPLKKYLDQIRAVSSREELIKLCTKEHCNLFFSIYVAADEKDADNNIVTICQSGLSLGNKDYYFTDDPQSKKVVEAMKKYITTVFTLVGYTEEEAAAKTARIWEIETELAATHYSNEKQRDVEANYHKMTVEELTKYCLDFDWDAYLKGNRYDRSTEVVVGQPEPVAKGCELLSTLPLEDLKTIYERKLIVGASGLLSDDFADASFELNKAISGVKEKYPRWKTAQNLADELMSDAVGQIFVKKYFSKKAKEEMLDLVANLQKSLGQRIQAQEWMCEQTKEKALEKLNAFTVKIGYPDKWDDLSALNIDPKLPLYENVRNATKFYWDLNYEKDYDKPVDKSKWYMPAQMVNAYYNPTTNEICFPAGFLQPPLFDLNADAAANYGSIGVVIAHEMTHGFDDQGRLYTKEGNMENWWTEQDAEGFKKPCDQMTEFFDTLWVIPAELKANGTLTLGENLADHGGLSIAYNAFQMWQNEHGKLADDNGFTPQQRFFLSYANLWAGTASKEILSYLTMTDVHSVAKLRVNGALAQFDPWYDAFGIQPTDSLYVAPENRVRVW